MLKRTIQVKDDSRYNAESYYVAQGAQWKEGPGCGMAEESYLGLCFRLSDITLSLCSVMII